MKLQVLNIERHMSGVVLWYSVLLCTTVSTELGLVFILSGNLYVNYMFGALPTVVETYVSYVQPCVAVDEIQPDIAIFKATSRRLVK